MQINQIKFDSGLLIYLLILSLPLCAIGGNLLINLNLFLTSVVGLILMIKNKEFDLFKENLELILLFLFFLIFFFINFYLQASVLKSFLVIKYFFFASSIVYFLKNYDYSLKKIFFFYSIICLFLIIDVIFQSYFSKNIFGIKNNFEYNSSFYGEEKLAGFHIQYFSFMIIFFVSDIFKKKVLNDFFLLLILVVIPLSIFVSLNRISLFTYLFGLVLFFIFANRRKKLLTLLSIPIFIFFANTHPNEKLRLSYQSFFTHSSMVYEKFLDNYTYLESVQNPQDSQENKVLAVEERYSGSGHANIFSMAVHLWSKNKLIGIGYKNFFEKCDVLDNLICSAHPHNIYLDILLTSGIIGFSIFSIILLSLIVKSLKAIYLKEEDKKLTYCLFISFFSFYFPLKSTGSLFSTYYGTFSFLIMALCVFHFNNIIKNIKN